MAADEMNLSVVEKSLLLAAYFRGNTPDDDRWISSCDQVVTLSLFYTGEITAADCSSRFQKRGCLSGLYADNGELHLQIETRYHVLLRLLREHSALIQGGGNLDMPADPTFTACRLTYEGVDMIPALRGQFPSKPEFADWPDKRDLSIIDDSERDEAG
ncbi:MAG: hypothetical protein ABJZ55_07625 [Fuerstiella sp.]